MLKIKPIKVFFILILTLISIFFCSWLEKYSKYIGGYTYTEFNSSESELILKDFLLIPSKQYVLKGSFIGYRVEYKILIRKLL